MRLKFITTNPGKFEEAVDLLSEFDIERIDRAYTEVQADSLEEVALYGLWELSGEGLEDFFIEDAGLFIHSLKGFPGVYSAYVNRTIGCRGIIKLVGDDRRAEFRSIIGLCRNGETTIHEGVCEGEIAEEEKGKNGFGFDPIFIPRGSSKTFAEMDIWEKNIFSHRALALGKLSLLF